MIAYTVRCEFDDAFAAYERNHAPRVRAEGAARIPPQGGVRLTRSLGAIVASIRA